MPDASTGPVCNSSNNLKVASATTTNAQATTSTSATDSYDSSYNLTRFLSDQDYPPGYKRTLSPEEAEKEKLSELRDFETKFASSRNSDHI
ncbi:hypothetical protein V8C35DRAFT_282352 [Trichoderma chlorosporum]